MVLWSPPPPPSDYAAVDESCLGSKKLHLNREGNAYFAKNRVDYIKSVY